MRRPCRRGIPRESKAPKRSWSEGSVLGSLGGCEGGPHGGKFASAGWHCGALLTRWKGGAPLDTTQGMGDTGSNRRDCTRLYGPASNSLAEPISDLLSQVRASERFGGEALTDLEGWFQGARIPVGEDVLGTWNGHPRGRVAKYRYNKGRGGMDAARITAKKNTPGLHPFQFVAKAGWQAGRSAQGDPPTLPRLLDSISRP